MLCSKKNKNCLLGLMKKKKETDEIKFIDVQERESSNHITNSKQLKATTLNIIHFAEQEDDTDLLGSEVSNPSAVVRKHLLSKVVTAVVHPVIVKGRNECESAVRYSSLPYILICSQILF